MHVRRYIVEAIENQCRKDRARGALLAAGLAALVAACGSKEGPSNEFPMGGSGGSINVGTGGSGTLTGSSSTTGAGGSGITPIIPDGGNAGGNGSGDGGRIVGTLPPGYT